MITPDSATAEKDLKKFVNMKLYVRYMVSLRCKMVVREELRGLQIEHSILPHGGIEFPEGITNGELNTLKGNLRKSGLDLLNIHESKMVEKIINTIIEVIHYFDELPKLTYSEIIAINLGEANRPVLKIFAEVVGMSVIQFIVVHKVERIKELLLYDNLPLSEITKILNYKSEQHLIAQFKKYTGLTPLYFRELKKDRCNIASQSL